MKIFPTSILLTAASLLLSACATSHPSIARGTALLSPTRTVIHQAAAVTSSSAEDPASPFPTRNNEASTVTSLPQPPLTATTMPTEIILPTVTAQPPTEEALPTETELPIATALPVLATTAVIVENLPTVNGVPVPDIVVMPANVRDNVRRIFLEGQQIGRNAYAFSKLGDSVTLTDHYLTRFDSGQYNLGPYEYLQPAIDYYRGSFARYGVATRVGLHAWSIFDPLWADKEWCLPNENIASCEIRLHNPSVLLIKIGSNDSGAGSVFEENLRLLLEYSIENGVVPILATKADRFEGPDDRNNSIIRQLAQEYAVPLWDYDRIASTLPRRGLSGDDVHMTMADADDYTNPETYERGYPVSDLTALMTLYEVMLEEMATGDA